MRASAPGPVDGDRHGGVAQLELGARQGDRLRRPEHTLIEADGRVARAIGVGKVDSQGQGQQAGPGEEGTARRVHDQLGEDRAGIGEVEGGGSQARLRRRDLIRPVHVIGPASDARLAAGDDGRGGQQDRRGAIGRGIGDEADDPPVHRLDRVVGRHRHRERIGEGGADGRRLRRAAGDGRHREALALEGADVDGADARLAALVGGRAPAEVPASIAGLPGSRGIVSVGPP